MGDALPQLEPQRFRGRDLWLAGDVAGPEDGQPVVLLHGGGQTRGSWRRGVAAVAAEGCRAISLDQRGHGESDWAPDGDYSLDAFVADLASVCDQIGRKPVLIGASLGGITSLLLVGEAEEEIARALILVDIVPRIELRAATKITDFMRSAPDGFASLDEAAAAVSTYLPHRPKPKDTSGLARNLRLHEDGRYRWHWDPAMMIDTPPVGAPVLQLRLEAAARRIHIPTLLIRGGMSQLVTREGAREFLDLVPAAEFVDVAGADHMVAGDNNDAFNAAVIDFLHRTLDTEP
jgi:non-heme chloroperoxidase